MDEDERDDLEAADLDARIQAAEDRADNQLDPPADDGLAWPYWCGRLEGELRNMLRYTTSPAHLAVAANTLDEYGAWRQAWKTQHGL